MGNANRLQVTGIRETTLGVTPTPTPRMRSMSLTSETLAFKPEFIDSMRLRSDRMNDDPIKTVQASQGGISDEFSYPSENLMISELIRSAMWSAWINPPSRDNDGTADSVITGITTAGTVATVTTGAAFVAGQLVRFSGFGVAGNNGNFKVTTGSATVPAFVGSGITDEVAPPAAARMKVIGFQGAAADLTTHITNGLLSTLLDFTTLGFAVGQWIKLGGSAAGDQFAVAALNAYVRITAISANALTLDNLPTGWATDAGTGKTIKIFVGDYIRNGTAVSSLSIEKGFLDQSVPTYIVNVGMVVNTFEVSMAVRQPIKYTVAFMGMGGSEGTATLDASPDAASTAKIMAGNANVGRLAENGATLTSPNWAEELTININNNNRSIEDLSSTSPVDIQSGECTVTVKLSTYFGNNSLLTKFYAGTPTSVNSRISKNNQAVIFTLPRVTAVDGNPNATAKNTSVMLPLDLKASMDTLTACHVQIDRFEYVE